jgi:hypothetical protein
MAVEPNPQSSAESRSVPRLRLAPMYTQVQVRRQGERRYRWSGFIYDISASGMRFELDEALEAGTRVDVKATLPGAARITIHAGGRVVRLHDDESEPGPVRMGMAIDRFDGGLDRRRLAEYLDQHSPQAQAA